jgi:hypothetical protein
MLHRAVLVRTDVKEELSASIFRVTKIGELGKTSVTSNGYVVPSSPIPVTLMKKIRSSETSVLTRSTRCNTPEDGINMISFPMQLALSKEPNRVGASQFT